MAAVSELGSPDFHSRGYERFIFVSPSIESLAVYSRGASASRGLPGSQPGHESFQWQEDFKGASLAELRVNLDRAPMLFHEEVHFAQAHSGPGRLRGHEWVEYLGHVTFSHSRPRVSDSDGNGRSSVPHRDLELSSGGHRFVRVEDEIEKDFLDSRGIGADGRHILFRSYAEGDPPIQILGDFGTHPSMRSVNELEDLDLSELECVKFRELHIFLDLPDHCLKSGHIAEDDAREIVTTRYVRCDLSQSESEPAEEKKVEQALLNSGLEYEDWFVVPEESNRNTILHLYVELKNDLGAEMEQLISGSRAAIEVDVKRSQHKSGIPLKVTILPRGTFQRYYQEKQAAGFDLTYFKTVRMNPPDHIVHQLISPKRS